ncbi:MAG TPA: sulfite exporter TauE/SafE family protein [Rhodocyclaceae bacterium]|nr:sulfite exporter TauE/SafE family protein [Rhodocyclaceae bacterium]
MAGSVAYANWDYQVSMDIIRNRRRLLLLLVMLAPILFVAVAEAAGMPMLGGKSAYAPSFYSTGIFLVSIAIGLAAGLITGTIGAGGGFIITPALMAVGVKGIMAVGTDVFHIFAKAIMGTAVHRRLGNVSARLAMAFLIGSSVGTFIGGGVNRVLYDADPLLSELFISLVYAVLLGFLGYYSVADHLRERRSRVRDQSEVCVPVCEKGRATWLQSIHLPPMIHFDEDGNGNGGRRISGVFVALGGLVVGVLASILGVGGGFITFPMFVFVFGVSGATTVGTDILQIVFTAGIAAITQYAINGYVFYTLAMGMLVGSLIGIQVGAFTTKVVDCHQIRGFYAITIVAGFINRAVTLPRKLVELEYLDLPMSLVVGIEFLGNVLFWIVIGIFAIWVFAQFVSGARNSLKDSRPC